MRQIKCCCLLMCLVLLMACAKDLSTRDKLKIASKEITQQYISLHQQYQRLQKTLPAEYQDDLDQLAKPMDQAKELLINYNDLVIAGNTDEATHVGNKVYAKIGTLAQKITRIAMEYVNETKRD